MDPFLLGGVALAGWLLPKGVHSFRDMIQGARRRAKREEEKEHALASAVHEVGQRLYAVEKQQKETAARLGGLSERLDFVDHAGEQALAHSQELAAVLKSHVDEAEKAYQTMGDISARAERTAIQAKELFDGNTETYRELVERMNVLEGWRESLQDGVSSLADEVAERLDTLGRRIEALPAEAENVSGMAEALREMAVWRSEDAAPKLAAFAEILQLVPAIQEQAVVLSESGSQMRSVLVDVADKVEVLESIVGRLPPVEPRTPMGPPPAGDVGADLAALLRQRSALQETFLARTAARGGQPIQPPSRP